MDLECKVSQKKLKMISRGGNWWERILWKYKWIFIWMHGWLNWGSKNQNMGYFDSLQIFCFLLKQIKRKTHKEHIVRKEDQGNLGQQE